jgi:MoaA/NifB/PqqE/SkfB family radical SAM enzyme
LVRKKGISIVSGLKLSGIRTGVGLTILGIAFNISKNPFKALRLLNMLVKERMKLHENGGEIKAIRAGSKYYWSINMPGWPSEKFNHFIFNEFQRILSPEKSNLQTIIFAITNKCPLNCIHCYESDNISDRDKLSLADLILVMAKIDLKGIKHIQFTGGEPLSRFDDMIELMRLYGESMDYWINTSGFGLTPDKALIMKENGMTGAIISLDDWNETRHNNFRKNNSSFYWVQEAVRSCNEAGIIVCLSLCAVKEFVSEENLERYHMLAKDLGAGFIRILEPRQEGRFSGKDVRLDKQQTDIISGFMISRNSDRSYSRYPVIQFPGYHQRTSGCLGAGNRYIYIDSNGNFHSCPFCRKPLGNALTESIDEGIDRARASGCHVFKQRTLI